MMIAQNKAKTETAPPVVTEIEAETQDEIDQIMSEIEELQQEMNAVSVPKTAPAPASATPAAVSSSAPKAAPTPAPAIAAVPDPMPKEEVVEDLPSEPAEVAAADPQPEPVGELNEEQLEQEILKEFSGEGDEPWLEETLAHLKAESTEGGKGILDDEPLSEMPANLDELESAESEAVEAVEAVSDVEPLESLPSTSTVPDTDALLAMTVKGNMALKINYDPSGRGTSSDQYVLVRFGGSSLFIQLSDGTELRVPLRSKNSKKIA